jgi:hypothetical protein
MPAGDDEAQRPIPATNEIRMFFHCRKCIGSIPPGQSPRTWARLEVGFTKLGIQVWCKRHECNVAHIDFEGQTHPANLAAERQGHEVRRRGAVNGDREWRPGKG